ncbi:MAG TPA: polyphosphate kinase 1 [Chitinophagaceae bacterium]|nr:polyphosphate kinase 1 [Chitinophagaceae bacterium]
MKKRLNKAPGSGYIFFDRDLSWLSFNERVLLEATRKTIPLMERIRFIAIYSSNLDEFYRVRMPTLMALNKLSNESDIKKSRQLLQKIKSTILQQLMSFGQIIETEILPELKRHGIDLLYHESFPEPIHELIRNHFLHSVASFIQIVKLSKSADFFPENNKLYLAVTIKESNGEKHIYVVNIPSDTISRFFTVSYQQKEYIVFLDDIVKVNLPFIFKAQQIFSHSFKITRNAELDLEDEFTGNLAKKIERKINRRDFGLATRFLYEPGMPEETLMVMKNKLNLKGASFVPGGVYHNLKDLATLSLKGSHFHYEPWPKICFKINSADSLFSEIKTQDILLHPPYHSYDTVLRFFNEAAIDSSVSIIYVTLYRVASESRIVNALISAAKNGKRVVVFVELKARFDEANNIRWSKKMKAAGVKIIESIPGLKVHAKLALIKRKVGKSHELFGLLSTGNFNEGTAQYYTDHILITSNRLILSEVEILFRILRKSVKRIKSNQIFTHLLVGQFNLQQRFLELIEREIDHCKQGLPASITIKFNNLEDRILISKLYEASNAGVKISLIVRGICCLVPGVEGMSENITVRRIIDRYLEHGRVFIFQNNNDPEVYLGSADWMNRNIYRRIEVCFPIRDQRLKSELIKLIDIQLSDNLQAVMIDDQCTNVPIPSEGLVESIQSQKVIGTTLQDMS